MIITKENKAKVQVIARKMYALGLGDEESLYKELMGRYCKLQIAKVM